ncbi:MAG: hypothetical protein MUC67_10015 [Acidobacteria bacterium]|jgi:hypothetical protein|nr:hypothetical protein [Acidobacteriota bacterium]
MKLDVSRDVVSDLWALCRAQEASTDSRKLVETFLAEDRAFAATLDTSARPAPIVPRILLSPDAERRLVDDARDRARARLMLAGAAIGLTALILLTALAGALFFMARQL